MPKRKKGQSLFFTDRKLRERNRERLRMRSNTLVDELGETTRTLNYKDVVESAMAITPEFRILPLTISEVRNPNEGSPSISDNDSSHKEVEQTLTRLSGKL